MRDGEIIDSSVRHPPGLVMGLPRRTQSYGVPSFAVRWRPKAMGLSLRIESNNINPPVKIKFSGLSPGVVLS